MWTLKSQFSILIDITHLWSLVLKTSGLKINKPLNDIRLLYGCLDTELDDFSNIPNNHSDERTCRQNINSLYQDPPNLDSRADRGRTELEYENMDQ